MKKLLTTTALVILGSAAVATSLATLLDQRAALEEQIATLEEQISNAETSIENEADTLVYQQNLADTVYEAQLALIQQVRNDKYATAQNQHDNAVTQLEADIRSITRDLIDNQNDLQDVNIEIAILNAPSTDMCLTEHFDLSEMQDVLVDNRHLIFSVGTQLILGYDHIPTLNEWQSAIADELQEQVEPCGITVEPDDIWGNPIWSENFIQNVWEPVINDHIEDYLITGAEVAAAARENG